MVINWTNPGPGGFYNDLGNAAANHTSSRARDRQRSRIASYGFDRMGVRARIAADGLLVRSGGGLFDEPMRCGTPISIEPLSTECVSCTAGEDGPAGGERQYANRYYINKLFRRALT